MAQAPAKGWPRGTTYEIFVQSFCDSNGDGIGDIKGMTSKLDYLKDLGIEGIWLMPMSPSPSYHKYDVTDYYGIHPDYGTMADFKQFMHEAHKRNIKVVMDLVLNHSSREHPWFKEAIKNPESPYWDYFIWTHKDDPQIKRSTRQTAADSDNSHWWNKVPGSDYLFYSYFGPWMPDLNLDNPKVREEIFKIGRYWLTEIGVDGFRLDAARHIFPEERPVDNHNWWIYFRNEMQQAKKDVYLVGEVWAGAADVAPFIKGLPALFNFDLGFAITDVVNKGSADSLVFMHKKIQDFYAAVNPDFVDAIFLTNHDQNRIMSAVQGDMAKAKMAAALLFTLPGSPYLYYGEEIGMKGMKPDEYIREPFLWDVQKKDGCRTRWIVPQYNKDTTIQSLAQQMKNKNSLYHHYKALISARKNSPALTYGSVTPLVLDAKALCAFERGYEDENLLVLHNLSKEPVQMLLPQALLHYKSVYFNRGAAAVKDNTLQMAPYTTLILKR